MGFLKNVEFRSLHLFAGVGGGILADLLLGHTPVCAVELEAFRREILIRRQIDGIFPWFPVWDDVRTFQGAPWRGKVDIVAGGFPCQDISAAGRGAGIRGGKSGLWKQMARIVGEVRPRFVFVENSPMLASRGLGDVLGDLAGLGYNAEWGVLGADDAGAPHLRRRMWILAHDPGGGRRENRQHKPSKKYKSRAQKKIPDAHRVGQHGQMGQQAPFGPARDEFVRLFKTSRRWWSRDPGRDPAEPGMGWLVHGFPGRVDRVKALGDAQVPAVAAFAWRVLTEKFQKEGIL